MTHPGALSSTTTVTGLPSTPSRNVMRQPQARRACVKPFSIGFNISRPPCQPSPRGRLQQGLDLFLECVLVGVSRVRGADASIAGDEKGRGKTDQRAVGIL